MNGTRITRRQFVRSSSLLAGAALVAPWGIYPACAAAKRTAVDQVPLGRTGLKLSRLGFGTGSSNGHEQTALGKAEFIKLIHYAHDQGITYIDTAEAYATFEWIGEAIRGLPRDKVFLQSKVRGRPEEALAVIDRHRKTFDTDYIDSLLIHCMTREGWTDSWKRVMDAFAEAKEKKWIRAKGVSCHTMPALRDATASSWTEVQLVRVNPQGRFMDGQTPDWDGAIKAEVPPVMEQIKLMHDRGHGVIGMKIIGNGDFRNADDREKSIRFAMSCPHIDAVVIGFKSRAEVDEAIARMNRALAEG
jgi:1-deoxyxylulose-5-phosphate synthase